MKAKSILVAVMILLLGGAAHAGYALIELGGLPDRNLSNAHSINNDGQIVGRSMHGFEATLFDSTGNGNNIDLGTLGGSDSDAF